MYDHENGVGQGAAGEWEGLGAAEDKSDRDSDDTRSEPSAEHVGVLDEPELPEQKIDVIPGLSVEAVEPVSGISTFTADAECPVEQALAHGLVTEAYAAAERGDSDTLRLLVSCAQSDFVERHGALLVRTAGAVQDQLAQFELTMTTYLSRLIGQFQQGSTQPCYRPAALPDAEAGVGAQVGLPAFSAQECTARIRASIDKHLRQLMCDVAQLESEQLAALCGEDAALRVKATGLLADPDRPHHIETVYLEMLTASLLGQARSDIIAEETLAALEAAGLTETQKQSRINTARRQAITDHLEPIWYHVALLGGVTPRYAEYRDLSEPVREELDKERAKKEEKSTKLLTDHPGASPQAALTATLSTLEAAVAEVLGSERSPDDIAAVIAEKRVALQGELAKDWEADPDAKVVSQGMFALMHTHMIRMTSVKVLPKLLAEIQALLRAFEAPVAEKFAVCFEDPDHIAVLSVSELRHQLGVFKAQVLEYFQSWARELIKDNGAYVDHEGKPQVLADPAEINPLIHRLKAHLVLKLDQLLAPWIALDLSQEGIDSGELASGLQEIAALLHRQQESLKQQLGLIPGAPTDVPAFDEVEDHAPRGMADRRTLYTWGQQHRLGELERLHQAGKRYRLERLIAQFNDEQRADWEAVATEAALADSDPILLMIGEGGPLAGHVHGHFLRSYVEGGVSPIGAIPQGCLLQGALSCRNAMLAQRVVDYLLLAGAVKRTGPRPITASVQAYLNAEQADAASQQIRLRQYWALRNAAYFFDAAAGQRYLDQFTDQINQLIERHVRRSERDRAFIHTALRLILMHKVLGHPTPHVAEAWLTHAWDSLALPASLPLPVMSGRIHTERFSLTRLHRSIHGILNIMTSSGTLGRSYYGLRPSALYSRSAEGGRLAIIDTDAGFVAQVRDVRDEDRDWRMDMTVEAERRARIASERQAAEAKSLVIELRSELGEERKAREILVHQLARAEQRAERSDSLVVEFKAKYEEARAEKQDLASRLSAVESRLPPVPEGEGDIHAGAGAEGGGEAGAGGARRGGVATAVRSMMGALSRRRPERVQPEIND